MELGRFSEEDFGEGCAVGFFGGNGSGEVTKDGFPVAPFVRPLEGFESADEKVEEDHRPCGEADEVASEPSEGAMPNFVASIGVEEKGCGGEDGEDEEILEPMVGKNLCESGGDGAVLE